MNILFLIMIISVNICAMNSELSLKKAVYEHSKLNKELTIPLKKILSHLKNPDQAIDPVLLCYSNIFPALKQIHNPDNYPVDHTNITNNDQCPYSESTPDFLSHSLKYSQEELSYSCFFTEPEQLLPNNTD